MNERYTVSREPEHARFPWIVTDSHGNPVLWRDDPKLGKVPQRFREQRRSRRPLPIG